MSFFGTFGGQSSSLRFPRENVDDYKGTIEFRLVTILPPAVNVTNAAGVINRFADDVTGTGTTATTTTTTTTTTGTTDAQVQAFDQSIGGGGTWAAASPPSGTPANSVDGGLWAGAVNATSNQVVSGRREIPSSFPNVTLYLPQAVQFNDGMEYDNNVQLGIMGAGAESVMNNGGSAYEALAQAIDTGLSSITDLFKQMPTQDLARLALARGTSKIPVVGDVISSVTRTAINPNRRTLFRGVRPREFGFTFKMIASSPQEALDIENIINFFRREMYPESINVGSISAGYKYPNPFLIDLKYNGKRVGPRILNSYLVNFQTTYNAGSMGYHIDGMPSEVDIQMNFFEERAIDRTDVVGGY